MCRLYDNRLRLSLCFYQHKVNENALEEAYNLNFQVEDFGNVGDSLAHIYTTTHIPIHIYIYIEVYMYTLNCLPALTAKVFTRRHHTSYIVYAHRTTYVYFSFVAWLSGLQINK